MYTNKSLKLVILTLLIATLVIFSGCGSIAPPINHSPTIITLTAEPPSPIEVNQSTVITCLAADQDGDTLAYSWAKNGGTITGSGSAIIWTAPATAGTYIITCTVSDGELIDIQAISIVATEPEPENQTPVITSTAITSATVGEAYTYNVEATDPDGDILTYSLTTCPAGMTIDATTGVISWTPTAVGVYPVTVEVSDGELTDTQNFTITVILLSEGIVYRAFLVGVGDYIYGDDDDDLPGPPYDVDRMIQIFNQCRFGPLNTEFSTIDNLKDWQATKSNILQGIASTFSAADNNDISYFYYAGHGRWLENISYICPADITSFVDSYISVDELENALSAIPGIKVVFFDTCHSGGFIGKGKGEITISQEELESFNDEIINVFSQAQSKGLLTTNQYKVLTACHYYQESMEFSPIVPGDFDPWGLFTEALCEGCGYYGSYPADTNLDTKVSLQEAYLYVKSYVQVLINTYPHFDIDQDVQVYPNNSTFTIVEY